MNKYFFLLLSILYFNKVVSQDIKNDTIKNHDTISISNIKIINKISFELINIKINHNQLISNEVSYVKNNININERDTLSMIIQLKGGNNDIIFNYYFNDNPNYRTIENGKIIYDKSSKRIYFDFIPNNEQALNKFLTWNLYAHENNFSLNNYNFFIEINNLDYAPKIINKQIDKIIRNSYSYNYLPIISDGDNNSLFKLETNAPIDDFDPINGKILWKINPNNIDELEKIFNFKFCIFVSYHI